MSEGIGQFTEEIKLIISGRHAVILLLPRRPDRPYQHRRFLVPFCPLAFFLPALCLDSHFLDNRASVLLASRDLGPTLLQLWSISKQAFTLAIADSCGRPNVAQEEEEVPDASSGPRMGHIVDDFNDQIVDPDPPTTVYQYQETPENRSWAGALPVKQALYDPELEKDACGVGFAASVVPQAFSRTVHADTTSRHIKGKASHKIVSDGAETHRRAWLS